MDIQYSVHVGKKRDDGSSKTIFNLHVLFLGPSFYLMENIVLTCMAYLYLAMFPPYICSSVKSINRLLA